MVRLTAEGKKLKLERIRMLMVIGSSDDEIRADAQVGKGCNNNIMSKRSLRSYKKIIRVDAVKALDGEETLSLWVDHVNRLKDLIRRCYAEIYAPGTTERELTQQATASGDSLSSLLRLIKELSAEIIKSGMDMGMLHKAPLEIQHTYREELVTVFDFILEKYPHEADNVEKLLEKWR